jgi:hypothetical protein
MAKIYNEVVIDMNPESPTFEETLYEDSYEYEGDMMLAQGDPFTADRVYHISVPAQPAVPASTNSRTGAQIPARPAVPAKWTAYKWKPSEQKFASMESGILEKDIPSDALRYNTKEEWNAATGATTSGGVTKYAKGTGEYGLESLQKSDFFEADGTTPKSKEDILALIKQHKPDVPDATILAQIEDMMPKLQGVSEEEKGFAREGFQKDVYGVSKDAGKAGKQMQQAYGSGMGSQMRGAYGAQKDVTQQFKQAEQGYEQDVYGLEQKVGGEFESDIGTWLSNFKEGGRVPSNKKTFLDVLSKIPDAGGN